MAPPPTSCGSLLPDTQPKMRSEPPAEGWERRAVKELVGANLEEVVFNPEQTVFLMFCTCSGSARRSIAPPSLRLTLAGDPFQISRTARRRAGCSPCGRSSRTL